MIENNLPAPNFTLPDLDGKPHSLRDYHGRVVILNFWSAECPWSSRSDELITQYLTKWGDAVQYFPIASNANESKELIAQEASFRRLTVLLHDENRVVADLYGAMTTPHLFVIDAQGILRYQGAFDDVTFRQREATRDYLCMAVEAVLAGDLPEPDHSPPYGCTVVRATL